MKRFTATEKWDDPWFRKLKPAYKLFWSYFTDKCDNCGVWKKDMEIASIFIGVKLDEKEIAKELGSRLVQISGDKWWVPSFITFQYGKLSPACIPHQKVVLALKAQGLYESFEHYLSSKSTLYPRVEPTLQEEEEREEEREEEDKEEDKNGRGCKGKPSSMEEVIAECSIMGIPNPTEVARDFWFFYESKGWMVGAQKMKVWRASLSGWVNRGKNGHKNEAQTRRQNQAQREFPEDIIVKEIVI